VQEFIAVTLEPNLILLLGYGFTVSKQNINDKRCVVFNREAGFVSSA
jgi:hypothetical protein